MSLVSNISFSEEVNLNDSIEFLRSSSPNQTQEFKPNLEIISDISSDDRFSSSLSRKYFLINSKYIYS